MDASRAVRRLTAIVALDVCGFSRMMRADEEGTLALLKCHRRDLVDPKIAEHRGRIVRSTGDGLLVEFFSAVDALRCAVEIQQGMLERNRKAATRMDLRIGVNVGDVIIDEGDIFGDVVNIAARLEGVAPPGGICLSDRVREDATGKVDVEFEDGGPQKLKNIDRPVHVHRVRFAASPESAAPRPGAPDVSLPGKPSIALMPLRNASADPAHELFTEGVTEDLVAALSRYPSLFVVARNTSLSYRDQPRNVRRVASELGVAYVVEGGIRRTEAHVGVGARLYDGASGEELWAGRYDGALEDVFEALAEVTRNIVEKVAPHVDEAEHSRAAMRWPENAEAYFLAQGAWLRLQAAWLGPEAALREQALREAREALLASPRCMPALCALAMYHWEVAFLRTVADVPGAITEGLRHAQQAVQLDRSDHRGYLLRGLLLSLSSGSEAWAEGLEDCRRARELNANDAFALYALGWMETVSGHAVPAMDHLRQLIRCDPRGPLVTQAHMLLALASFVVGDYRASAEWAMLVPPAPAAWQHLAACHVGLQEYDRARAAIEQARALAPEMLEARLAGASLFRRPEDRHRHTMFMRIAAGLEDAELAEDLR